MAENISDSQTCDIIVEAPKEEDSFLEESLQVCAQATADDHEVPYPYEYPPAYAPPYTPPSNTYLPSSTQKPIRENTHDTGPKHIVHYHNQGPLLPQEIEIQKQLNPPVQCILVENPQATNKPQPLHVVPDYCCVSCFVCLCCAWPCGIAAIIASRQAKVYAKRGEYLKAKSIARLALYLIIASVLCGLLSIGLSIARYFHQI